jgi:hypothetical protein
VRIFGQVLRGFGFLAAGLFVAAIIFTQYQCPIPECTGNDIDAWLLPAAFAPIGVPALIWSIVFVVKRYRR